MNRILLPLVLLATCGVTIGPAKAETAPKSAESPAAKKRAPRDIQQLLSQAKKEDKLVFIQMGREGCGNCKALRTAINNKSFDLPESKFIRTEINADDPKVSADFDKRFKVSGKMLPFVAIANAKGKLLASSSGHVNKEKFEAMIAAALGEGEPKPKVK